MSGPRIGSLFSGYGGLDLAVTAVFGGEVVWHAETDPDAATILKRRWPGVPNLGDVSLVDWERVGPVDVLCGGFPCTDVSSAGLRAGMVPGTRSGLWAHMARAVQMLRPGVVVIENVAGLFNADGEPWPPPVAQAHSEWGKWSRVADLVVRKIKRAKKRGLWHGQHAARKTAEAARAARLRDRALDRFKRLRRRLVQRAIGTVVGTLSQLGYDSRWRTVRASGVGAPHHRERVFIVAAPSDPADAGREEQRFRLAAPPQHAAVERCGR
jgi:DNA (cytosine-5)-methyltransferase 1